MLKPVAAGLMCLGFVTLGVTMSRGQDAEDTDLIVIEGKVNATEVTADELKQQPGNGVTFTTGGGAFGAGGEAGVSVNGQKLRVVRSEKGGVTVYNEDGKVIEQHDAGPLPGLFSAQVSRVGQSQQVADPQTREALEKMAGGLKEQIQKLQSEGKQDEAQQKARSLEAIDALLHGHPQVRYLRMSASPQNMEEIKKLHDRMRALVEESSKLPEGASDKREKVQQEIAKIQKEIAEKHQAVVIARPEAGISVFGGGQPFQGGGFGFMTGGPGPGPFGPQAGFGPSAGTALLRKSEALSQAAAQLKSSGLDEQAQPLLAKAEQLKAEAQKMMQDETEKRRAQGAKQGGGGFGGMAGFSGGPPMELHRSIRELQEQIQQLRKEVGELRELLQRKQ